MADNIESQYSAKKLHEILDIPHDYLRHILTALSKAGFISSAKGRNGGFVLIRDIDKIYLSEIIDATEGLESIQKCMIGNDDCNYNNSCSLHLFWEETRKNIIEKLKTTSLLEFKI